jgi:hypothetical protein
MVRRGVQAQAWVQKLDTYLKLNQMIESKSEGGASLRQGDDTTTGASRVLGYSWWFLLCVISRRGALAFCGVVAAVV